MEVSMRVNLQFNMKGNTELCAKCKMTFMTVEIKDVI